MSKPENLFAFIASVVSEIMESVAAKYEKRGRFYKHDDALQRKFTPPGCV